MDVVNQHQFLATIQKLCIGVKNNNVCCVCCFYFLYVCYTSFVWRLICLLFCMHFVL